VGFLSPPPTWGGNHRRISSESTDCMYYMDGISSPKLGWADLEIGHVDVVERSIAMRWGLLLYPWWRTADMQSLVSIHIIENDNN
jgi:hypothetical protein